MDGMAEWWLTRDRRESEEMRERDARLLLTAAAMRFRANDLGFQKVDFGVTPGRLNFRIDVDSVVFWATYRELAARKGWPD